jgi:hypothetical protein
MTDCPICCEEYTETLRACVECPNPACEYHACKQCVRRYLTTITSKPHCMSCKNQWNLDFLKENLNTSWMNKEYKNHRKTILFEHEKSRIPETMPAVEAFLSLDTKKKELITHRNVVINLRRHLETARDLEYKLKREIDNIKRGNVGNVKSEKKFIKPCPVNDCKGFLSSAYKCGVCNIFVCSKCHEIKGDKQDSEHTCNPDTVKTIEMMKKDTKPCPSCAASIHKISGCDQMWCTQCKVAFSWRTGLRVNGVIHNPHYYQWQKQNGGNMAVPGAVRCGGIPDRNHFWNKIKHLFPSKPINGGTDNNNQWRRRVSTKNLYIKSMVLNLHRCANHVQYVIVDDMRRNCQRLTDNKDLRIKYITKEIDEKKLKTDICRRDNKHTKNTDILQIYELMNNIITEACVSMYNIATVENLIEQINRCIRGRVYCNEELKKISVRYNQCVDLFRDNFYQKTSKFKKADLDGKPPAGVIWAVPETPIWGEEMQRR